MGSNPTWRTMYKCKYCEKEFEKGKSYRGHISLCSKNPNSINNKPISDNKRKNLCIARREYIELNGGKKHTQKTKNELSLKRKKWLNENKNLHNWSLYKNEQTEPEKRFENELKELKINYCAYYVPDNSEHNYEIDFALIDKKIGFEINGNQHYTKEKEFTEYHKNRKLFLENIGWKIIDLHYSLCFNKEKLREIILSMV